MKGDTVSGIIFTAFGGLFLFPSLELGLASQTSDGVPGAGFFPFWISVVVIAIGLTLFIMGIKSKVSVPYFSMNAEQKENLKPFFLTGASVIVFLVLWLLLGFLPAAIALSILLNVLYKRTIKFIALYTLLFVGVLYYIFYYLLRIQFVV